MIDTHPLLHSGSTRFAPEVSYDGQKRLPAYDAVIPRIGPSGVTRLRAPPSCASSRGPLGTHCGNGQRRHHSQPDKAARPPAARRQVGSGMPQGPPLPPSPTGLPDNLIGLVGSGPLFIKAAGIDHKGKGVVLGETKGKAAQSVTDAFPGGCAPISSSSIS